MRNMLALIGTALVVMVGLGWYLGWYRIQSEPTTPGHRHYDVEINTDKISADIKKGTGKITKAISGDGNTTSTTVVPPRPIEAQPTSRPSTGIQFNDDGSVSYTGRLPLPPLAPRQQ